MPRQSKTRSVKKRFYRTNQYIRAPRVRVVDQQGKQVGIMPTPKAIAYAQEAGLDLIEVAPHTQPPVAKIIDLRSFLYEKGRVKQKKEGSVKKQEVKEIWFNPFMGDHDFSVRIKRMENFLNDGNKVKVTIRFRGREITHKQFGNQLLERILKYFGDKILVEAEPKFKGHQLMMTLAPKRR